MDSTTNVSVRFFFLNLQKLVNMSFHYLTAEQINELVSMIETSVMKELTLLQKLQINSLVFPNQGSDKNCFNDYEFESTLQESDFNYKKPIESFFSTGAAIKWCSQMFPINTCEGINVIMKFV